MPPLSVDVTVLTRELPDTARAAAFDGEPMVQSFLLPLPGGGTGRAWVTTAEALAIPGFGRAWVAGRLASRLASDGPETLVRELSHGLRLRAVEPAALPLAA